MTTQQKIEFYLSNGFAVEVKFKNGSGKAKLFTEIEDKRFIGYWENDKSMAIIYKIDCKQITNLTPIPPKPYEFKVGERVMIFDTKQQGEIIEILDRHKKGISICEVKLDDKDHITLNSFELAPALPEDEECEVVEVTDNYTKIEYNGANFSGAEFTKPDGKKLKIKVVSPK